MEIIKETTFEKARNSIKKTDKTIIFSSDDDELNRKVLEKLPIKILLINQAHRKDYQKQRNSGLDSPMAKVAKKNKITIGINLKEILESSEEKKEKILSRIRQNIKLCNKNKLEMIFLPKLRDSHSLKALGLVLGMPTWMTKDL